MDKPSDIIANQVSFPTEDKLHFSVLLLILLGTPGVWLLHFHVVVIGHLAVKAFAALDGAEAMLSSGVSVSHLTEVVAQSL